METETEISVNRKIMNLLTQTKLKNPPERKCNENGKIQNSKKQKRENEKRDE